MTAPFTQYLDVKDNYCLAYFGEDKDMLQKMLLSRDNIEKELKGMKIFIACKDTMKSVVHGKRNIILESKMGDFRGKIACFRKLEEKSDLKSLLEESKVPIPEDF